MRCLVIEVYYNQKESLVLNSYKIRNSCTVLDVLQKYAFCIYDLNSVRTILKVITLEDAVTSSTNNQDFTGIINIHLCPINQKVFNLQSSYWYQTKGIFCHCKFLPSNI